MKNELIIGYLLSAIGVAILLYDAPFIWESFLTLLPGLLAPAAVALLLQRRPLPITKKRTKVLIWSYYSLFAIIPALQWGLDRSSPDAAEGIGFVFALAITFPWIILNCIILIVVVLTILVRQFLPSRRSN